MGEEINVIDVGASDGIATKFFCRNLKVKNIICYEPNHFYIKILRKLNIKNLTVKPFAVGDKIISKKVYFPRYKFLGKNLDLIPYTYYDKKTLLAQLKLDFKYRKNIQIIEKKLHIKKIKKIELKINLIKIDVNDNGLSVINAFLSLIKRDKPALLVETDSDILEINMKFLKIKKEFPLNTYFLQKRHLKKIN